MPLKIPDSSRGSISVLNRWADSQESTLTQHDKDIQALKTQLAALQKAQKTS